MAGRFTFPGMGRNRCRPSARPRRRTIAQADLEIAQGVDRKRCARNRRKARTTSAMTRKFVVVGKWAYRMSEERTDYAVPVTCLSPM
jgi:hypothetical protein